MSGPRAVDPELPWGVWLHVRPKTNGLASFLDEATGREWRTIREAFWCGRLGMPLEHDRLPEERLEFLHGFLSQWARRPSNSFERTTDMFAGNHQFSKWYLDWLQAQELIDTDRDKALTAEGWAVLHMLMATRPQEVRQHRPGRATVLELTEVGLGPEEREARLRRVEQVSAGWDVAFRRSQIGAFPSVILVQRGSGPVPVLQTTWTLQCDSADQRDAFYEWLCVRLDRWPHWVELAKSHLGRELTHHLLVVMAASLEDDASRKSGALPGR